MTNKNKDWKPKAITVAALIAALALAFVMFFDDDPETSPDIGNIVDKVEDVRDAFKEDESDSTEIEATTDDNDSDG